MLAFALIMMVGSLLGFITKIINNDMLDLDSGLTFIFALTVLIYIN